MPKNLPPSAIVRQPRGIVKINDEVIPGWVSVEVDNNTFYEADTFRVTFATSLLPPARNPAWLASQKEMFVEIFVGLPVDVENFSASDLTSLIYGRVDDVMFTPSAFQVELSGRDLTAAFIDTKSTEKWPNKTSSQIAQALAARHNMTASVTATTTRAGKYYDIDHVRLTDQRSEWDLLSWLAHEEQFNVYVKGKTLHFEQKTAPSTDPYLLTWQDPNIDQAFPTFTGKSIEFTRALNVAKGIQVVVRSWNQKAKKGFTVSYPNKAKSTQAGKASPFGNTQIYSYTFPNLTQAEALQKAQALHKEITQHEMKLVAELPADNILSVTDIVKVVGTNTAFDQIYYPDSIRRTLSKDGYTMTLHAKNHSPDSVVSV